MSGSAAMAAARRRRVNLPQQQSNLKNSSEDDLNKMIDDLKPETKPQRLSLGQVVNIHDKRINFLKNEIDIIKNNNNNIINNSDKKNLKVTFSDTLDSKSLDELKNKISTIETYKEDSNKKILELENELSKSKKEIENFKLIFLNINKIINELKTQVDINTNEMNNMTSFLENNKFISNEDININENNIDDNTDINTDSNSDGINSDNRVRMVIEENM